MKKTVQMAVLFMMLAGARSPAAWAVTDTLVSVGSPPDQTPRNHVNEPAVAMDAHDPDVLVAGGMDYIDFQDCPKAPAVNAATCRPGGNAGVGIGNAGVYFSFDRGNTWTQPMYTGWTGRDCVGEEVCPGSFGAIGTLPWYYEAGLETWSDPGVSIGPQPVGGRFSWANGSRVYYSTMVVNFPGRKTIRGAAGIAVSRLDNPTPERVADKSSWMPPVLVNDSLSSTTFSDKEQVWADNAESSPYFGNVYVCFNEFQGNGGPKNVNGPSPMFVATSSDGGAAWNVEKVTSSSSSGNGVNEWNYFGCTVRTDSDGVAYLFAERGPDPFRVDPPFVGTHSVFKSFDGGKTWTKPSPMYSVTEPCFKLDPFVHCVMDGYTGARTNLAPMVSADIANGAPTGGDATDLIVTAWSDGGSGLNSEQTRVTWSTDRGESWHAPVAVSLPGDRPLYSAIGISPSGDRAYVVYEAVTSPWRDADMDSPRPYHGVFLTAPVGPSGPGAWTTVYNGPFGDLRGTYPGHRLSEERVGDYVYAAASRDYGVGLWIDARDAAVCQAVQDWRGQSLAAGEPVIPAPWPLTDCPATFGNTDVWAATTD